jgi:hypothetical protein
MSTSSRGRLAHWTLIIKSAVDTPASGSIFTDSIPNHAPRPLPQAPPPARPATTRASSRPCAGSHRRRSLIKGWRALGPGAPR